VLRFVCLSVCPTPSVQAVHFMALIYDRTLTGNHMLEVELTCATDTRNSNEPVASTTSEAFARWQHHRYASVELPSVRVMFSMR